MNQINENLKRLADICQVGSQNSDDDILDEVFRFFNQFGYQFWQMQQPIFEQFGIEFPQFQPILLPQRGNGMNGSGNTSGSRMKNAPKPRM